MICSCEIAGDSTGFASFQPFAEDDLQGTWATGCLDFTTSSAESSLVISGNQVTLETKFYSPSNTCNVGNINITYNYVYNISIDSVPFREDESTRVDLSFVSATTTPNSTQGSNLLAFANICGKSYSSWNTTPGVGNPYDNLADSNCELGTYPNRQAAWQLKSGVLNLSDLGFLFNYGHKTTETIPDLNTQMVYVKQ